VGENGLARMHEIWRIDCRKLIDHWDLVLVLRPASEVLVQARPWELRGWRYRHLLQLEVQLFFRQGFPSHRQEPNE
jgi:hypothetical protein